MREIKFRAWDKTIKKMFRVGGIDFDKDRERFVIMQYTHRKDKNRVEIYEHDFLEHSEGIGEVRFINGSWVVGKIGSLIYLYAIDEDSKVIGNMFESPELINA